MTGLNKKQHLYIICWLVATAIGFYYTIDLLDQRSKLIEKIDELNSSMNVFG